MRKLIKGKEEIIYLLSKAIDHYKLETGQEIVQNTNRKNYEALAIVLSAISNQLPLKFAEWGTDVYRPDSDIRQKEYPYRKYDITGGQIKDALSGIVSNPRSFLIDACYVYLFGIGRKAFEQNPIDVHLLEQLEDEKKDTNLISETKYRELTNKIDLIQIQNGQKSRRIKIISVILAFAVLAIIALTVTHTNSIKNWATLKRNMNILPYQPTAREIDSLEGIWLCYTGSPQARISDPERYHKVVPNLISVQYKDGYFTFLRYGASFNHTGYMQFESPGIVSVYSRIKNNSDKTASPRHSLLNLHTTNNYFAAISASWNFDVGEKNKIIGIREVYTKLGKGGTIEEVLNEIENASCKCKVIRWEQENKQVKTFYLKNELLDSLPLSEIKPLLDEKSILLGLPQDGLLINKDSTSRNYP